MKNNYTFDVSLQLKNEKRRRVLTRAFFSSSHQCQEVKNECSSIALLDKWIKIDDYIIMLFLHFKIGFNYSEIYRWEQK
jgi:hypothetical protein